MMLYHWKDKGITIASLGVSANGYKIGLCDRSYLDFFLSLGCDKETYLDSLGGNYLLY